MLTVNKKGILVVGALYTLIGYILLSAALYREDFSPITFYEIKTRILRPVGGVINLPSNRDEAIR